MENKISKNTFSCWYCSITEGMKKNLLSTQHSAQNERLTIPAMWAFEWCTSHEPWAMVMLFLDVYGVMCWEIFHSDKYGWETIGFEKYFRDFCGQKPRPRPRVDCSYETGKLLRCIGKSTLKLFVMHKSPGIFKTLQYKLKSNQFWADDWITNLREIHTCELHRVQTQSSPKAF